MLPYLQRALRQSVERARLRPRGARRARHGARARGALPARARRTRSCSPRAAPSPTTSGVKGLALRARARPPHHLEDRAPRGAAHRASALESAGLHRDLRRRWTSTAWSIPTTSSGPSAPTPSASAIMHANSEVGTIQPVAAIGAHRARARRAVPRRRRADVRQDRPSTWTAAGIDLLSFSGHKIYGPKGVAGLWIRKGTKMVSVQHGGEHERRRRAGTENVPGIVGLGKAVEVRARDMHEEAERVTRAARPALGGHPGAGARRAPQRPPDRAAARDRQHLLPRRGVGIDRPRPGSEGHRRCRRARRAPRATWSRRTCWWRWACRSTGRWAPCATRWAARPRPRTSTT